MRPASAGSARGIDSLGVARPVVPKSSTAQVPRRACPCWQPPWSECGPGAFFSQNVGPGCPQHDESPPRWHSDTCRAEHEQAGFVFGLAFPRLRGVPSFDFGVRGVERIPAA